MGSIYVSIVIPAYNSASTLKPLLESVISQVAPPDEVIVVDDASRDNSGAIAGQYDGVRVVRLNKNSGPSVARNKGAEAASNEVILFLDSDVVCGRNNVAFIKEMFFNNPEMVALNGVMGPQPLNPGICQKYKALIEYGWGKRVPPGDTSSKCLNARVGAIRRDVFMRLGGFDTVYKTPLVEDHEFGLRLTQKYVIHTHDGLVAFHHFPGFARTIKNYFRRANAHLELVWSSPSHSGLDNGGVSMHNALQFLLGALVPISLLALFWGLWWIPLASLLVFIIRSWPSLRYHWAYGGPVFFLCSVSLHLIYGCAVTLAGIKTLITFKLFGIRYFPKPQSQDTALTKS